MKRGEKALLICQPEFAYGEAGSMPRIPPNSTDLSVELLDFHDKRKMEMNDEEKMQQILKLKLAKKIILKQIMKVLINYNAKC